jgi:REP element-mobilizing transposase RayT
LGLPIEPPKRGGFRAGAGRPAIRGKHDPDHVVRPYWRREMPLHIVLRTVADVPRLRQPLLYAAIRSALHHMLNRCDLRIVHVSIQGNHLHMIVEHVDRDAVIRGMQAFTIKAARAINKALGRMGKVFAYRYHATAIESPRQMRHVLAYVLNNWRRHNEDQQGRAARAAIDPYSTAIWFGGWKSVGRFKLPAGFEPLPMANPMTWLLTEGWRRHGDIDPYERPGPRTKVPKRSRQ